MDTAETIRTRRSVHEFSDEPLSDETLAEMFDRVRYTPSGYNLQPWEFLVLRDEASKAALQEVAYGQEQVTDAAAAVVVLGNTDPAAHAERVFDDWLEKGYLPNEEVRDDLLGQVEGMADRPEAENRLWTTRSTSLAAMTLMHAAWDLGVASCPMEGFDADGVRETFDVGEGYEPVMLVTLGYPADGTDDIANERKLRRPVEEIVHEETFEPEAASETDAGAEAGAGRATGDD
jgi:nitroreductase